MEALEERLRLALVARIGGGKATVSCAQVLEALSRQAGVPADMASVHLFAPEDFLVMFATEELRDRVAALPGIAHEDFALSFRRWTRQARAELVAMRTRVHLVVEGLPPHAWETDIVEDLLGKGCSIEEVAPETRARRDLAAFKLTAWTSDLSGLEN